MAEGYKTEPDDPEPTPGPSGVSSVSPKREREDESSSTSESDISPYSESFKPMKALYSERIMLPVPDAPMFDNLQQFEASLKTSDILPVGKGEEVKQREEKKQSLKLAYEKALEERNRQRFAKYEAPTLPVRKEGKNVLTRQETVTGPLAVLRRCMKEELKVKVMVRDAKGIRGNIYGYVSAFDKHWNMVLTEVLEVYRRKATRKLKTPPAGGRPVPKGTATMISSLPSVVETPVGGGIWECVRHVPQMMVRGEHVVLVNVIEQ